MDISVGSLLRSRSGRVINYSKLTFNCEGVDVYNITAPFVHQGRVCVAGRVEHRDSEFSRTIFFEKAGREFRALPEPIYKLQDPFITQIGGEMVFGGVEFDGLEYSTIFYRGNSIASLKELGKGPMGMKDIRLIGLKDGRIGIFTRPQGIIGGRGRIGFFFASSLDEFSCLDLNRFYSAPLIGLDCPKEEWIGANEAYLLEDGRIGVLAHIASMSGNSKNYYPFVFIYDPSDNTCSDADIIASREELGPGISKRESLRNVLFGGGLLFHTDGSARLYAGAGDAESYEIAIRNPFKMLPLAAIRQITESA